MPRRVGEDSLIIVHCGDEHQHTYVISYVDDGAAEGPRAYLTVHDLSTEFSFVLSADSTTQE